MKTATRDFQAVLTDMDGGELVEKLTQELAAVVQGVLRTETKGKLVLEMQVSTDGGIVLIAPKVKATIPAMPMRSTAFAASIQGPLSRQLDLGLGEVVKMGREGLS